EEQAGPFKPREIIEMSRNGQVDRDTIYFEPAINDWRHLSELYQEEKAERLAYLRNAGMPAVQFTGGGLNDECPVCRELLDRILPIAEAPAIPPENCTCIPWCKATYVASR